MPTYDPKKPVTGYPAVFAEVMLAARDGGFDQRFRKFFRTFPPGYRRLAVSQALSSFKASVRNHPAHALHAHLDNIRTKVEWDGDDCYLVAWKHFRPASLLKGVV